MSVVWRAHQAQSTNKGVNWRSNDVTQAQQQGPVILGSLWIVRIWNFEKEAQTARDFAHVFMASSCSIKHNNKIQKKRTNPYNVTIKKFCV